MPASARRQQLCVAQLQCNVPHDGLALDDHALVNLQERDLAGASAGDRRVQLQKVPRLFLQADEFVLKRDPRLLERDPCALRPRSDASVPEADAVRVLRVRRVCAADQPQGLAGRAGAPPHFCSGRRPRGGATARGSGEENVWTWAGAQETCCTAEDGTAGRQRRQAQP
jgi:hypothetical protein